MPNTRNPDQRFIYPDGAPYHSRGLVRYFSKPAIQISAATLAGGMIIDCLTQQNNPKLIAVRFAANVLFSTVALGAVRFIQTILSTPLKDCAVDTWGMALHADRYGTRLLARSQRNNGIVFAAAGGYCLIDSMVQGIPVLYGAVILAEGAWRLYAAHRLNAGVSGVSQWTVSRQPPGKPVRKSLLSGLGLKVPAFGH